MFAVTLLGAATLWGAEVKDPGVRGGPPGAGTPLAGAEPVYFVEGRNTFGEVYSVLGTLDQAMGLGPRFNGTSCAACHAQPAIGGSSPRVNPQLAMAKAHGARNLIPSFVKPEGPVQVVRFKLGPDGARDGEVTRLFTITGRTDAGNCTLSQPDFSDTANMILRIPTPTFGAGLIERIPDRTILGNRAANARAKQESGISGKANRSGDGAISRFGWKAQNASLLFTVAEAFQVEIGTIDEALSYARTPLPPGCEAAHFIPADDDPRNYDQNYWEPPIHLVRLASFMRFLDQPKPVPSFPGATAQSIANGKQLFNTVGCAWCHTPTLSTGVSSHFPALNGIAANLYSDLLVHRMGPRLADGIYQGAAGPDEFRTAPLWGVGQRTFFLHDGRTPDLLVAIREHQSGKGDSKSEAYTVIDRFNALGPEQRQDVLNFLRSL